MDSLSALERVVNIMTKRVSREVEKKKYELNEIIN